jgi:hypothetical protein
VARGAGIDLPLLLVRINARLTAVATVAEALATARMPLIDLLPEAPQIR